MAAATATRHSGVSHRLLYAAAIVRVHVSARTCVRQYCENCVQTWLSYAAYCACVRVSAVNWLPLRKSSNFRWSVAMRLLQRCRPNAAELTREMWDDDTSCAQKSAGW
jgi:hypothetical protein